MNNRLCFTLFSQLNNESDDRFIIENNYIFRDFIKFMAIFYFRQNVSKIMVALHPRKEPVRDFNDQKSVEISHSHENGLQPLSYVVYRRIISHSLPKPYETQCVDYQKRNYTSRRDCIYQCRIKKLSEFRPGKWLGSYLNYNSSSDENMVDVYPFWSEFCSNDVEIGDSCKEKCGLDYECYSELYEVSLQHNNHRFPAFYVPILPPDMPDLVYTQLPNIQMVEFLSYLGSAISLFFGISVIMVSDSIMKFSKHVWNKYQIFSLKNQMVFIQTSKAKNKRRTNSSLLNKKDLVFNQFTKELFRKWSIWSVRETSTLLMMRKLSTIPLMNMNVKLSKLI